MHRLPAIKNGSEFRQVLVCGLYSLDNLVQVYGEKNARNLSSLGWTKLILAAANLDTVEQGAYYIASRELR